MTWNCRLIDKPHNDEHLSIGDMFYVPIPAGGGDWISRWVRKAYLSDYYFQHNSHRQPLIVMLPGRILFPIDGKFGGFIVSGNAPNITVEGVIDFPNRYKGYLKDGVISADLDGRTFSSIGVRLVEPARICAH